MAEKVHTRKRRAPSGKSVSAQDIREDDTTCLADSSDEEGRQMNAKRVRWEGASEDESEEHANEGDDDGLSLRD